ncbi:MAG TPA: SGNH/GDSL hydrolase family protein [Verrucomicrobiae bacterium]|nr:SGNH/GDSL hydrolase family protein [Verrucomicrobiae bacterium]
MKLLLTKLWLGLIVACCAATVFGADFLIHDGDRVMFLGDSITEQRLYTTYIEAYALTRHPEWKLWFRNVGWGGDTSWLRQRSHPDEAKLFAADNATQQQMVQEAVTRGLERDVLPLKPTFVTVKFGMNDHSYQPFREDIFKAYVRSQTEIAQVLKANGARVAFLTPQPIEDKRPDPDQDPRNQSLRKFSDGLKEVAAKEGAAFVDQFDPYMSMLLRERPSHADGFVGGGDAVHPGPIGHTVMAWAILKGLGAPALVSTVDIDCGTKQAKTEGCQVNQLHVSGNRIDFERVDEALPMPIDPKAMPALKLAPVLNDLNRYEIRVAGLQAGNYELTVDSEPAGKATAEQLAEGWNIATGAGPITEQAQKVLRLVFEKNNLFYKRWRNVQLYALPEWAQSPEAEAGRAKEIKNLDEQIHEAENNIDAARKPTAHRFEIKPAQ